MFMQIEDPVFHAFIPLASNELDAFLTIPLTTAEEVQGYQGLGLNPQDPLHDNIDSGDNIPWHEWMEPWSPSHTTIEQCTLAIVTTTQSTRVVHGNDSTTPFDSAESLDSNGPTGPPTPTNSINSAYKGEIPAPRENIAANSSEDKGEDSMPGTGFIVPTSCMFVDVPVPTSELPTYKEIGPVDEEPEAQARRFRCWVCHRQVARLDSLNRHLKRHAQPSSRRRLLYAATLDENSDCYDPQYQGPLDDGGRPLAIPEQSTPDAEDLKDPAWVA
jgi:hypothetical protein